MANFGPDKVFCPNFQIAISQEHLWVRSWNFQSFHISMIPTNGAKMKKFLRGKGVMPWMIWYGIAQKPHPPQKKTKKQQVFSTSMPETSESNCFYSMIGFSWSLYSHAIYLWCG